MDGMTGIAGGAPANQQMMQQPAQQPQGIIGGMGAPQPQAPQQMMQAPQQMMQAPQQMMQQPRPPQGMQPQGMQGGKPKSLFDSWRKDENGDYAELTGNDVAAIIQRLRQNPQAGMQLKKMNDAHNGGGNISTGDFRKDAVLGMTHLITALAS